MTAFVDLSEYVNRVSGGNNGLPESVYMHKDWRAAGAAMAAPVAGRYTSLWQAEGSPAHGSLAGTTAVIPDATTPGGLLQTVPGGGRQRFLSYLWAQVSAPGTLIFYDRLLHVSGLSGTNTSAQTVGGSITRNVNGKRNFAFMEINSQLGISSTTFTINYTDDSGNTGQTSVATPVGNTGLREPQRVLPISLAQGDAGLRAIASVTLAVSTGSVGDFGIVIGQPIWSIGVSQLGIGGARSWLDGTMPDISNACIGVLFLPNGVTSPSGIDIFAATVER